MLATPHPLPFSFISIMTHNLICLVVRNCSCLQWLKKICRLIYVRMHVCDGNGEMSPRRRNESDCGLRKGKWMLRWVRRGTGGVTSIQTMICNCICEYTHTHTCIHNFCICAHIICCNFVLPHAIKSARVMLERETGPPPLIKGFAQSLVTIENDLQNATNCAATWCVWVRAREVYPVAERERRIRRLGLCLANLYLLYR